MRYFGATLLEGQPLALVTETGKYGTLRTVLKDENLKLFSLKLKSKMAVDVAQALFALHQQKLIHRSIQPENIIVKIIIKIHHIFQ